jgi:hypothetical protein
MQMLTTAQAARVVGIDPRNAGVMIPRLACALDARAATQHPANDRVVRVRWSPGAVVAMAVIRALDPHGISPERWADGAGHVGDAHERGLCPAYLVTAGGSDYGVVLDAEEADRAAVGVASRFAAERCVARVVPVAPIVEDLCDVLDFRALA